MNDNDRRAERARLALEAHADDNDLPLDFEPEDRLSDLLTDLRHWAHEDRIDFNLAIRRSQENFNQEHQEALQ